MEDKRTTSVSLDNSPRIKNSNHSSSSTATIIITTTTTTTMKENDGRGARKKLMKRLGMILLAFVSLITTLHFMGFGKLVKFRRLRKRQQQLLKAIQEQQQAADVEDVSLGGSGDVNNLKDERIQKILNAEYNLVDITVNGEEFRGEADPSTGKYSGIYGQFCALHFAAHKESPSEVPMFRDLVQHSPDCEKQYSIDLNFIAEQSRLYDANVKRGGYAVPKPLNLTGVVFHESRCGSTLVANTLIGMNPTEHRTYSESSPPITALKSICGDSYNKCTSTTASIILRDVIYMMSRTNDEKEKRVFFKIQSIGTRNIEVFRKAFPTTPWMFVYRDPVQVMMSHFAKGKRNANCLRYKRNVPPFIKETALNHGYKKVKDLSAEQFCATHLASITEMAVEQLKINNEHGIGTAVNYVDLPDIMYQAVLPMWGVHVGEKEIDNIKKISGHYSKARYSTEKQQWKDDTKRKEDNATPQVRQAAKDILEESYNDLELISDQFIKRAKEQYGLETE